MRSRYFVYSIFWILASSCTSPRYLPEPERIPQHPFGSYIKVDCPGGRKISGELIAVEKDHIVVLGETTGKCVVIQKAEISVFSLQYAQSRHYGWTIPLSSLVSLSHGMYAVFSMPLNLIASIAVTSGGEKAFVYQSANMTYQELKMFARFPQGVPSGISLEVIH